MDNQVIINRIKEQRESIIKELNQISNALDVMVKYKVDAPNDLSVIYVMMTMEASHLSGLIEFIESN